MGRGSGVRGRGVVGFACRYNLATDWVQHRILAKCSSLEKHNDIVTDFVKVLQITQTAMQALPADLIRAQSFDFKVLHRWVPPAEVEELAHECRARLSSAAARIEEAAVEMLAEVVRGSRRVTADEVVSLQRQLSSASTSHSGGATQRHLIEVICQPDVPADVSDEKLIELHGKVAQVLKELSKPEEGGQELDHWWCRKALWDAGLQEHLAGLVEKFSGAVVSQVNKVANNLWETLAFVHGFVEVLPDMDQEVEAYMLKVCPCKKQLSAWTGEFQSIGTRLDHLKEALAQCVPKADKESVEALVASCEGACTVAAGCLRRGTESAAPWDITDGMAAFSKLLHSAELCQMVLQGHLLMAAIITYVKDGSGCEHDPKKRQQFTNCVTGARTVHKRLAEAGHEVPGMQAQLDSLR